MKKLIVSSIVCLILVSCNQREAKIKIYPYESQDAAQVIEMDATLPAFTKLVDGAVILERNHKPGEVIQSITLLEDYEYVPLETTDECLLSRIDKLICDSSYLFIYDGDIKSAYCFSIEGKFICKYGAVGRGPNEYINLCDIFVNKGRNEVCLYDDFGHKMLFYSYEGALLRTEPTYFNSAQVAFSGENMIVNLASNINEKVPAVDYHRLLLCNNDKQPVALDFPYPKQHRSNFHYRVSNLISTNNNIYYGDMLSDTIWRIEGRTLIAEYIFKDPSRKPFTLDEIESLTTDAFTELYGKRPYLPTSFTISNDFACFRIHGYGGGVTPLIYNRRNGVIKSGMFTYDADKTGNLGELLFRGTFTSVTDDGDFVIVNTPTAILHSAKNRTKEGFLIPNAKDKHLLDNLSEEDNPVLMLVKLKDF